jgi:hypothetical protein
MIYTSGCHWCWGFFFLPSFKHPPTHPPTHPSNTSNIFQAAGVVVVFQAGDNGQRSDQLVFFPGAYEPVVNVGAANNNFQGMLGLSNYGPAIDLFAPGSSVFSLSSNASENKGAGGYVSATVNHHQRDW